MKNLDAFTCGYIEAALWSSIDEDEEPLNKNYGVEDISPEALKEIISDCEAFQSEMAEYLEKAETPEYNGHDLWLTRNRHGSGFWDRDYDKEIAEILSGAAEFMGECYLYVGDNEKIHLNYC